MRNLFKFCFFSSKICSFYKRWWFFYWLISQRCLFSDYCWCKVKAGVASIGHNYFWVEQWCGSWRNI